MRILILKNCIIQMWSLIILTLLQPGVEIFIDDWQVFREMFCISSQICSFNSGLLLKTLLLRYSQRKQSIGDKIGLQVGQLMSPRLDLQKFCILNKMNRWRCDMLPHVGVCTVINVNLRVECGLKMFWARLRCWTAFE